MPDVVRPRMSEQELADLLGLTVGSLRQYRWRGQGPAYEKIGQRIWFRVADVEAWLDRHRVDPEAAS